MSVGEPDHCKESSELITALLVEGIPNPGSIGMAFDTAESI